KEHVTRFADGGVYVYGAVASMFFEYPVMIEVSVNRDGARAVNDETGFDGARLERRGGRHDLKHRTWRELRLDGLVHERLEWVGRELLPLFRVDTLGEVVGVEGRVADHGQDFTRTWINRHHRTRAISERSLRHHLQVQIEGEAQIVSGQRVNGREQAH